MLIEDYGAQKYLQSFPGAFAPLSGKVDYSGFAPYKVAADDRGRPGLWHALRLWRHRPLLPQGLSASRPATRPRTCKTSPGTSFIEIGKQVEAKTGKKMLGLDINRRRPRPHHDAIRRQLVFRRGRQACTSPATRRCKAALETEQKILQPPTSSSPAAGWTEWVGTFTSGDVASVTTGVWITGTVKAQPDQSGKWGVAPIPALDVEGATHASNLGGSSWYVLERSAEKDAKRSTSSNEV